MRLLNVKSKALETFDVGIPPYAIVSHCWEQEEITYQDICLPLGAKHKAGLAKIDGACNMAMDHGIDWMWIDTCCIDKTSSAELSEAINSMYRWYEDAAVCYAYLSDIPFTDPIDLDIFSRSRWFTRGWTLQELIAPAKVIFVSKEWKAMAEKTDLVDIINKITGIPESILSKTAEPAEFSVAARMSWASNRETTRTEDEAYSLIGLFGIHMPLIYGEKEKAFIRLQQEIMKVTDDQSIFAWALTDPTISSEKGWQITGLLAGRPKSFAASSDIVSMGIWGRGTMRGMSSRGTRAKLFLKPLSGENHVDFIASLDCWLSPEREHTVVIFLRRLGTNTIDWDSPHETTFGRIHPFDRLGHGSRSDRADGVYREICVPQMDHSPETWNLHAYGRVGAHILIHHPGRPYSVCPVDSWEPQTAVFTLRRNNTGTIGAVGVSGDDCTYIIYFGSYDTPEGLWVKADLKTSGAESIHDDAWRSYQFTGEETSTSEIINPTGMGLYAEKVSATSKLTVVWEVLIYEIRINLSRVSPRQIMMYGQGEDSRSTHSV